MNNIEKLKEMKEALERHQAIKKECLKTIKGLKTISFFDIVTWGQPANGIVYHLDDLDSSQWTDIKRWMSQVNNQMYHDKDKDELRIAIPSDAYKSLMNIEDQKIADSLKII
jgi:hypothetical protein|tara:strand:+ start:47 stop:382 length:336 start_codon:yes stop_codon:yes gene_type:complete